MFLKTYLSLTPVGNSFPRTETCSDKKDKTSHTQEIPLGCIFQRGQFYSIKKFVTPPVLQ
jgi:hypothetical protein